MQVQVPWTSAGGSEWHRVLVYGLGLSGRAAAEWLRRQGVEVVAVDRREADQVPLGALADDGGARLLLGDEPDVLPDDLPWEQIDGVVVSPGVPVDRPLLRSARERGVPVIGEVELAFPWLRGPILAITGSNGKSTTTAMAGAMLHAAGLDAEVCGNIGEPLTSKISSPTAASDERVFVVELSSFQLESVDLFRPRVAALLNLAPDHLDRHASFAAYRDAKLAIFRRQTAEDVAVVNGDDPEVLASTADLAARRRFFSRMSTCEDGCFLDGDRIVEKEPGGKPRTLFTVKDVPLPGPHNLENAMAAALLARSRGVSPEHITAGLRSFRGLPHRLEKVRELDGVAWFDDSKGTNLAATLKSLEGFPDGEVLLILGGIFKGGDLESLAAMVAKKARVVYLIGRAAPVFADALAEIPGTVHRVDLLERAILRAREDARPGETVLLSPACSSFDQFPNFAERGRIFARRVRELPGEEADHGA